MRKILYNISENFNVFRWSITIVTMCFVAIVGIYKYVDLSDNASITFSSLETTYLLLSDFINISFIYLPLYLFLICGIGLSSSFGHVEILKYKSRSHWYFSKFTTLLFYTFMFFVCLFSINFFVCSGAFVFTETWSTDFVRMQVSNGQLVDNFTNSPIVTIIMLFSSMFFMYLLAGIISLIISITTGKESVALILSVMIGMATSLIFSSIIFIQHDVVTSILEIVIFVVLIIVLFLIGKFVSTNRDFAEDKGGKFEV